MTILQTIIIVIVGFVVFFILANLLWFGLSLIKESFSFFYLGFTSKNWKNTRGKIIVSQVKKELAELDYFYEAELDYFYEPEIKYSYMVNNKIFYGDRISFNQSCIVPKTPKPAEEVTQKYLLGSDVTVFYDVYAPGNSSLEIGAGVAFISSVVLGITFGLFFILTAIGAFL